MAYQLDHVGLATKDLDRSYEIYRRMGFTLSPRSIHSGQTANHPTITPWGSGNHLAMFENGYFELLGLIDSNLPSNVKRMVEKYEGMHVLAIRSLSIEKTYASLKAAGVLAKEPIVLERDALFGEEGNQTRRVQFRNVYLDELEYPDARYIFIEHRNPDVLWQPHLMRHPNGSKLLIGAYLTVTDLPDAERRLTPLFGKPVVCPIGLQFTLGSSKIWVSTPLDLQAFSPVLTHSDTHSFAGVSIQVESLETLKEILRANYVRFSVGSRLDGRGTSIWVGPEAADHGVIEFIETE